MRPIGEPVDVHMPDGTTVHGEWRIETPKTPSGISLFHHLTFPDDYGWPTDEQLATAIRKVEEEMPPTSDLRINRDGVFMSLGCAGLLALLLAASQVLIILGWPA